MNREGTLPCPPSVETPPTAPTLRITAGVGSATQKTWNVRRPVTLIGSRRPAHVVVHDSDVDAAHCVIVNTGTHILLKDLHTQAGTNCNDARIDLVVLQNGDVVTVGTTQIRVAINPAAEAAEGNGNDRGTGDPTVFPEPVVVGLVHSDRSWRLKESVILVGKHQQAPVCLNGDEVSDRHAVIFRSAGGPAIFDVGGREGIWVNGLKCTQAPLHDGDRVTVGPFGLQLGTANQSTGKTELAGDNRSDSTTTGSDDGRTLAPDQPSPDAKQPARPPEGLEDLQSEIGRVWERLNEWQDGTGSDTDDSDALQDAAAERERELNLKDAALRGQLHDLTCLRDQLADQERELDELRKTVEAEQAGLAAREKACTQREEELAQKSDTLVRRERAVAQRWSRLRAATCPSCGSPFPATENTAPDSNGIRRFLSE